ncbi:MAG: hypothetical protein F4X98_06635 [Gammaproteobacteria bacterium]|nr:hypothetical protein [Gammaproteobacteria bacterium]
MDCHPHTAERYVLLDDRDAGPGRVGAEPGIDVPVPDHAQAQVRGMGGGVLPVPGRGGRGSGRLVRSRGGLTMDR